MKVNIQNRIIINLKDINNQNDLHLTIVELFHLFDHQKYNQILMIVNYNKLMHFHL